MGLPYDHAAPRSIEEYAKRLVEKSLRNVLDAREILNIPLNQANRGRMGQVLEKYYFKYEPNNRSEPDFPQADLELKSTPVLYRKNGQLRSKERLVLNIINFMTEHELDWEESSFWKKNKSLLLLFYLHETGVSTLDRVFKLAGIWEYPPADLMIIRDDWKKIVDKIREGKAHELSEGDTFYLGACTKGRGHGRDLREQPFSSELAHQRAFSLKQKYVNTIIDRWSREYTEEEIEPILGDVTEVNEDVTFEQLVINKFDPYIGLPITEIHKLLRLEINTKAKNYYSIVTLRILGVKTKKAEEFEKADVVIRTIRLKKNYVPKEDISFPHFKYKELVDEEWDTSSLKGLLQRRFFFVVFQYNDNGVLVLHKVMFWTIPYSDLEIEVKRVWNLTIDLINDGKADQLPKKSESPVCHVRPHARNAKDTNETPDGRFLVKKSFWLNAGYIKEQLELD